VLLCSWAHTRQSSLYIPSYLRLHPYTILSLPPQAAEDRKAERAAKRKAAQDGAEAAAAEQAGSASAEADGGSAEATPEGDAGAEPKAEAKAGAVSESEEEEEDPYPGSTFQLIRGTREQRFKRIVLQDTCLMVGWRVGAAPEVGGQRPGLAIEGSPQCACETYCIQGAHEGRCKPCCQLSQACVHPLHYITGHAGMLASIPRPSPHRCRPLLLCAGPHVRLLRARGSAPAGEALRPGATGEGAVSRRKHTPGG